MRTLFLLAISSLSFQSLNAGTWNWAKKGGGSSTDFGYSIAADAFGNLYTTGYYKNTGTFGSHSAVSKGQEDLYIAKYDDLGGCKWMRSAGGTANEMGYSIVASGTSVYAVGSFNSASLFGSTNLSPAGLEDIFITKLDSAGTFLWTVKAGGTGSDVAKAVCTDNAGNIYVSGYYGGTATFGSFTLTNSGSKDIFLAKYDPSGTCLWVKKTGGSGEEMGNDLAVNAAGTIYLTGQFNGVTPFGSYTLTSKYYDIFLAAFDVNGNCTWAKRAGGGSTDDGRAIVLDNAGNIYLAGFGKSTGINALMFDSISLGNCDQSAVIAKYDAAGTCLWAAKMPPKYGSGGCSNCVYKTTGTGIALDAYGVVYIAGYFENEMYYCDANNKVAATGGVASDVFVGQYDAITGSCNGIAGRGGSSSSDETGDMVTGSNGKLYVTGTIAASATFGNIILSSQPGYDTFIAELGSLTTGEASIETTALPELNLYPNPAKGELNIRLSGGPDMHQVSVYNAIGAVVYETMADHAAEIKIDISGLTEGIYFVRVVTNEGQAFSKQLVKTGN